ncbi:Histidinol-phosphate/aromatic aminotransferase and cobyric acid decarboxylase [Pyrobaculum oguniense TE7]|uniref:Aminotransferase n=1 Tax=Pyrobaculum oguniense (strain DSM 13380 / JCM 10595 / TE7) TaxID=698757 RepID=H6QAA6_PYROT|nr:Histidinol-phosphate/aromatic aminotransferase and cobyric acid decarboxylase [Pyrobaculum oguniense TE7]
MHGGTSWRDPPVLDFSDNSNPLGPPQALTALIKEAVERGVYLKFPANAAEEVLAEYEGIDVVAFNGATEALTALMAYLKPKRVLVEWPNYTDYSRIASLLGLQWRHARGPEEATAGDLYVVSNPNNPTGRYLKRGELAELAKRLAARGAKLLVDESFIDFVGGETAAPDVPVAKSYGKLLAAPGLRVGAVLGMRDERLMAPWRLNSIADFAVYHLGADGLRKHRAATVAYVAEESPRVQREVSKCAEVNPSPVHFFIVKGPTPRGVKVRPLEDHGIPGYRVSIRTPELNRILVEAICREVR